MFTDECQRVLGLLGGEKDPAVFRSCNHSHETRSDHPRLSLSHRLPNGDMEGLHFTPKPDAAFARVRSSGHAIVVIELARPVTEEHVAEACRIMNEADHLVISHGASYDIPEAHMILFAHEYSHHPENCGKVMVVTNYDQLVAEIQHVSAVPSH